MVVQQTDAGFVVTKGLAWTMAVGLMVAGIWLGTHVAAIESSLASIDRLYAVQQGNIAAMDMRLRKAENAVSGHVVARNGYDKALERMDNNIREIEVLLREILDRI